MNKFFFLTLWLSGSLRFALAFCSAAVPLVVARRKMARVPVLKRCMWPISRLSCVSLVVLAPINVSGQVKRWCVLSFVPSEVLWCIGARGCFASSCSVCPRLEDSSTIIFIEPENYIEHKHTSAGEQTEISHLPSQHPRSPGETSHHHYPS